MLIADGDNFHLVGIIVGLTVAVILLLLNVRKSAKNKSGQRSPSLTRPPPPAPPQGNWPPPSSPSSGRPAVTPAAPRPAPVSAPSAAAPKRAPAKLNLDAGA